MFPSKNAFYCAQDTNNRFSGYDKPNFLTYSWINHNWVILLDIVLHLDTEDVSEDIMIWKYWWRIFQEGMSLVEARINWKCPAVKQKVESSRDQQYEKP